LRARGVEIALAFLAGAATFAAIGSVLAAIAGGIDSDVVAALPGAVCLVAVIAVARLLSIAYAVPIAMAGVLSYDWYWLAPTHPFGFPNSADLGELIVYLVVAVLVGQLAVQAARRAAAAEVARAALADEQAALRRVAILVARGTPRRKVFEAVAREVGRLLATAHAYVGRFEAEDTVIVAGSWSADGTQLPVGRLVPINGEGAVGAVARTGLPARKDDFNAAPAGVAAIGRAVGARSAVAAPILVDGSLWGTIFVSSSTRRPFAADTEARLSAFTDLVATAISNAEARTEMARLAEEQAALRRVATLVAREASPEEVFAAVAKEVGLLLRVGVATMFRYEDDGTATVVAVWGDRYRPFEVGTWHSLEGENVTGMVLRTGRAARIDNYANATGPVGTRVREAGLRAAVACPIVVDGRLWGAMVAATEKAEPLAADIESRVGEFTELVATAISNIQARTELAASRARIVAATDEERRRVVRDLHDGAQQRLVHTVVTLKLARDALQDEEDGAPTLVTQALDQAEHATAELRELAHGILPAVLTRGGLRAGVSALCSRMPVPVTTDVSVQRLPEPVEATAYFVIAEALTNVAKHANAKGATVAARVEDGTLRVEVQDDGVGGARRDGSGLQGLGDRLAVLNGRLRVDSPPDGGTLVAATIPLP
jgi:signal transduction histidine kinase